MKAIHILPFFPPHIGGMEIVTETECKYQAKSETEVVVLTSEIGCKRSSNSNNIKIYRLKTISGKSNFPIFFPSLLWNVIKHIDKDVILHIHCGVAFNGDILPFFMKLLGMKTIMHVHLNPTHNSKLKSLFIEIYKHVIWRIGFIFTNVVICPTYSYFDEISKYGVNKKKFVGIHNGIDINSSQNKHNSTVPSNILFVGRLAKEKNVNRLLDAFKLVQEKYSLINLHIVGDGEKVSEIKAKIKNENIKNVIMHGPILHTELYSIYQKCDIFVSTSDNESFGNTLLEAMNFGLPIVATDIPAYREVLGNAGILSKPTPEDFAKNIIHLIENETYRLEIVSQERERIKEFDIDNTNLKVMNLYHSLQQNI